MLSARAAQNSFERRPVDKYAFTIAKLNGGGPSIASREGGADGSRGLAISPELGQVISVGEKSNIICHRETLSLSYLRRNFLKIGRRGAWEEVCIKSMTVACCAHHWHVWRFLV